MIVVHSILIKELNVGAYCFQGDWLWENLKRIPLSSKGEYYLTDMVAVAVSDNFRVKAVIAKDPNETIGVNTPEHLAEAEMVMKNRKKIL